MRVIFGWLSLSVVVVLASSCRHDAAPTSADRSAETASPYFIIVAGEALPIATRVVTWLDPEGYDAHRERCWFEPERILPGRPARGCNTPRRYGRRATSDLPATTRATVDSTGWTAAGLRDRIHQFVIHYDVCVTSRRCFEVLHDRRGLSVHFLLDVDGTIYQTLDLEWRARHAGLANTASVGIEIAHIGAYPDRDGDWNRFYGEGPSGDRQLEIPQSFGPPHPGVFALARPGVFQGEINGVSLVQRDFTAAQYGALATLTDFLCREFPLLRRRVPRDESGEVLNRVLAPDDARAFAGIVGHYHVSAAKSDPGPAFDWERLLR